MVRCGVCIALWLIHVAANIALAGGGFGACCTTDLSFGDVCRELDEEDCVGTFVGDGTECLTQTDCPVGACCTQGTCLDQDPPTGTYVTSSACDSAGGIFLGVGTDCTTAGCVGACCYADRCDEDVSDTTCTGDGGTYGGADSTCASIDCVPGACCSGCDCTELTPPGCNDTSSSFMNSGTTCDAGTCDTDPPAINCSTDFTVGNDPGQCGAVVNYAPPVGTDNCPGASTNQTAGLGDGAFFPVGATTETYQVTDAAGQTAQCSFMVTVIDTEPPIIICPADITVGTDPGQCGATVTYSVTETDNCPGASTAQTGGLGSGGFFPIGMTTETCDVSDAAGNTNQCSFKVTVNDVEPPAISCPADMTVNNDPGTCGAVVDYNPPVGTDNCPGANTLQANGQGPGSLFPVGATVESYEVTDAAGHSAQCSFTVTVVDTEAPTIDCPADITVGNDPGACGAVVNYSVTADDNCPGVSVARTAGQASGSLFPVGTTTVTYQATDAIGNTADCSFTVTVNDTEPPTVGTPAALNACYDDFATAAQAAVDATRAVSNDNCTAVGDLSILHAPTEGECATTFTLSVYDEAGNGPITTKLDTFVDGEDPVVTCPADLGIECGMSYEPGVASATDNCALMPEVTLDVQEFAGDCADGADGNVAGGVAPPPKLTIQRTFTGNDGAAAVAGGGLTPCNNVGLCTQIIEIFDTTPPTIEHCPEPLVVDRGDKLCSTAIQDWLDSFAASDICDAVALSNDAPDCGFPAGVTTVTFTATDECALTTTCTSTITVHDAPRIASNAKGSLLTFSKVEIKWNGDGTALLQDTFLSVVNDYPNDIAIQAYFINGDISHQEVRDINGQITQAFEPGWNTADCLFMLTGDQPHYWSAATGSDNCQPFTVLDDDGPGRRDPETNGATRVLRGYVVMWAVAFDEFEGVWQEIQWNHLQGSGILVNYALGTAWEYNAWAAQARCGNQGEPVPDCFNRDSNGTCCTSGVQSGVLDLDGFAYDIAFDTLHFDFYGSGSTVLSGGNRLVDLDTDLTLHPVTLDLRQDGFGPVLTKVEADVWNEYESKFSGARRCICCWNQTLVSQWSQTGAIPNYFMRTVLGTDRGKARLRADDSIECDYSQTCGVAPPRIAILEIGQRPDAILGLAAKFIAFGGGGADAHDAAGMNLAGSGRTPARMVADIMHGGEELNPRHAGPGRISARKERSRNGTR